MRVLHHNPTPAYVPQLTAQRAHLRRLQPRPHTAEALLQLLEFVPDTWGTHPAIPEAASRLLTQHTAPIIPSRPTSALCAHPMGRSARH